MAIVLPLKVDGYPSIRIITKRTWSSSEAWTEQPMVLMEPKPVLRAGFEFLRCRRTTIDGDGTAVFRYVFGRMDGRQYPSPPDLQQYEVRILATDPDGDWWTIWWGTVEQQLDVGMAPGADYGYGVREYHCLDGVCGRMRHWPLDRHGVYVSGGTARPTVGVEGIPCRGHPGFNSLRWDGRIAGTKDKSAAIFDPHGDLAGTDLGARSFYHTYPGNGNEWTDKEAVETAIAESRPKGEVKFILDGAYSNLTGRSVWKVEHGISCLEFLRRVLRRQRGRGLAFCDWDEGGDPLSGSFTPIIRVYPQVLDSVVYTPPGIDLNTGSAYASITIQGATEFGSTIEIDLQGDHRLGPDAEDTFELGDRAAYAVQYLETEGERIEVAMTAAFDDSTPSLQKRWEDGEATAFAAANAITRSRLRFDAVYQLYGLSRDWGGEAGNGNAGTMTRADFRCGDDGSIVVPGESGDSSAQDTSPLMVEVMRDLPLYAEYNYQQGYPSERYDGLDQDPIPPARRAPLILYRTDTTSTGKFLPMAPAPESGIAPLYTATFQISDYGIMLFIPGDVANGVRTISDPAVTGLGASVYYNRVVMTLGLRLPHRVRMATAAPNPYTIGATLFTAETAPRRKTISVHGIHLWLGHTGAIWEVDPTTLSNGGYTPRRGPANAASNSPGVIRDDRAALQQIHQLAWLWYGSFHRTASWQVYACGLVPQFSSGTDGTGRTSFPRLGQIPTTISAAGQDYAVNTPITVIDYDHVKCVTRSGTDWSDLDVR